MARVAKVVCAVLAASCLLAPVATATTRTFGSDLDATGTVGQLDCTSYGLQPPCTSVATAFGPANAHPTASPIDGVIVRVRFRTEQASTFTLRLARPVAGGRTGGGTGPQLVAAGPGSHERAVRLSVLAGDLLAVDGTTTVAFLLGVGVADQYSPLLVDGAPGRPLDKGSESFEYLINADVESDADGDGYGDDTQDNCRIVPNPGQQDRNGDGAGDACDDQDGDGRVDAADNCPDASNPTQIDRDGSGGGDACDPDANGDGVRDGTARRDVINGTRRADRFCGLGGNDVLNGLQGNDTIFGDQCGAKSGVLVASVSPLAAAKTDGNDRITGSEGDDRLYGSGGNDVLDGSSGKDRLYGGRGRDVLDGGSGVNVYSGGAGNDRIDSANGRREKVACGAGRKDRVRADRKDRLSGCEIVKRS